MFSAGHGKGTKDEGPWARKPRARAGQTPQGPQPPRAQADSAEPLGALAGSQGRPPRSCAAAAPCAARPGQAAAA
eukprot:9498224-Pyramimonas_sp.AAC.1